MKLRVSECITLEDIRNLEQGFNYTIKGGTGSGKSYFIRNVLIPEHLDKKILVLTNRTDLRRRFENELANTLEELELDVFDDMVDVKCYQTMKESDFEKYDVIVCDEFHYLTSDSWNRLTNSTLEYFNEKSDDKIKVFLSATQDGVVTLLNNAIVLCEISTKSSIEEVRGVKNDNYLGYLIEMNGEGKIMNFANMETTVENHKKLLVYGVKSSMVCSHSRLEYKDFACANVSEELVSKGKFLSDVLNGTIAVATGLDFKDSDLKYIGIQQLLPKETIFQAVGRKRLRYDVDGIEVVDAPPTVIVQDFNKKSIQAKINEIERSRKQFFEFHRDKEEYLKNRPNRNYLPLWLEVDEEGNFIVNKAMLRELKHTKDWFEEVKEKGYPKAIAELLEAKYIDVNKEECEQFLMSKFVGVRMFKEQQKQFKETLELEYGFKGRSMGIKTINAYFEEQEIPYTLDSKRVKVEGKLVTIWILEDK